MASARLIELTDENTCKICEGALARYSCPRCNAPYCSLTCYQSEKHRSCSEDFYRDCVVGEMGADAGAESDMLDVLRRAHEDNKLAEPPDSDDDVDVPELAERLAGIDLDAAVEVWDRLTDDERQEFVAFLRSGDVSKLVPRWEPWWSRYNGAKVAEVGAENAHIGRCPPVLETIKEFTELTSKPPAGCVEYNLVNVLAAYVLAVRYFNGEHRDFEKEAAACVSSLSLNLKVGQNFEDFETAVKSVEQECVGVEWIIVDSENIALMREDLMKVLRGPGAFDKKFYVLSALSDLHATLEGSLQKEQSDDKSDAFSRKFRDFPAAEVTPQPKDKVKMHLKKIEYLLSYTKHCWEL